MNSETFKRSTNIEEFHEATDLPKYIEALRHKSTLLTNWDLKTKLEDNQEKENILREKVEQLPSRMIALVEKGKDATILVYQEAAENMGKSYQDLKSKKIDLIEQTSGLEKLLKSLEAIICLMTSNPLLLKVY